jgi:SAM-dependent methyltransferase
MMFNSQTNRYWLASILCIVSSGFVLPIQKKQETPTFNLNNPWSTDVLAVDQLRLSAVRGTTPNPIARQSIETLLKPLDIQEGDVVADIGCGSGYTLPIVLDLIGSLGTVYAVEFPDASIEYLQQRMARLETSNVIVHQDIENNLLLPKDTLDKVFLINVMHAFRTNNPRVMSQNGIDFVASMYAATKAGGKIMIIDSESIDTPSPNDNVSNDMHVLPQDLLHRVFTNIGFTKIRSQVINPRGTTYSVIYEKPVQSSDNEI